MNKQRAKRVDAALAILREVQGKFEDARNTLRELADEEQECFDNLSEGLQQSEQGQRTEECAGALETLVSALEELDFDNMLGEVEAVL